jgi:Zn-dependent peptidase ImmA (M78 family)
MSLMPKMKRSGDSLEKNIRDYFESEISADRFYVNKSSAKVRWKPKYFSKDRNSHITFDVSIEVYLPDATEYSFVLLIECKNYSHSVPVDDAEEFFQKVQQVAGANSKAVIASTAGFQSGTREFAKSKGIGLLRYFNQDNCKWELKRSPSAGVRTALQADSRHFIEGLANPDFQSLIFDLYLQSPTRETNSLWDFMEDMLLDSELSSESIRKIVNARNRHGSSVSFIEKDELETIADSILSRLSYAGGELNLEALCEHEHKKTGLIVSTDVIPSELQKASRILGRISFDPLIIEIYRQAQAHRGRERFTLAHELAHHLLAHGEYLEQEYCEDSDFVLSRQPFMDGTDIARMEFQANFLAGCILMPRLNFIESFQALVRTLSIPNRGFGALYVDDQACNLQNFEIVTKRLMLIYGTSYAAVKIRLESMGLLHDHRKKHQLPKPPSI